MGFRDALNSYKTFFEDNHLLSGHRSCRSRALPTMPELKKHHIDALPYEEDEKKQSLCSANWQKPEGYAIQL